MSTEKQGVNASGQDLVVMLPDNTEELLTGLHQEFYGHGLAHADAFRLIPSVIARLKQLGEIPAA